MTFKSNWKNDKKQEEILTKFFHKILFEDYINKKYNTRSKLVDYNTNKELQYDGVDILWEIDKNNICHQKMIDLKAQTNKYINNPTNTFCTEVESIIDGRVSDGWIIKDQLTDYYLFVWIHKAILDDDNWIRNIEQLEKVEFMFVMKKDILGYLTHKGINRNLCKQIAAGMRRGKFVTNETEYLRTYIYNDVKFTLSKIIAEKPVNIVFSKNVLKKFRNSFGFIYEDKIVREIPKEKKY